MRFFLYIIFFSFNIAAMDAENKLSLVSQFLIQQIHQYEKHAEMTDNCFYKGKLLNNANLKFDKVTLKIFTNESTQNHGVVYINTSIEKLFTENEVTDIDNGFTFMEKKQMFYATLLCAFAEDRKELKLPFYQRQTHAYCIDVFTKGIIEYRYKEDQYSVLFETLIDTKDYIKEFFKEKETNE